MKPLAAFALAVAATIALTPVARAAQIPRTVEADAAAFVSMALREAPGRFAGLSAGPRTIGHTFHSCGIQGDPDEVRFTCFVGPYTPSQIQVLKTRIQDAITAALPTWDWDGWSPILVGGRPGKLFQWTNSHKSDDPYFFFDTLDNDPTTLILQASLSVSE